MDRDGYGDNEIERLEREIGQTAGEGPPPAMG